MDVCYGRRKFHACLLAAILSLGGGQASAQQAPTPEAAGVWTRDDGAARIQFSSCGAALCGAIVWLKSASSKAHVGQQVFFDMARADQNSWTGKAFNPEDGKTYSGKMVLTGKKLKTSGCMLGGLICKTVLWRRGD
jgi:uncharacterized protein (DUF2147 family)